MKLKKLIIALITLLSIVIVGCGNDKTPTEEIYEMYMYPKIELGKIGKYIKETDDPQNSKIVDHLNEIIEQNDSNIKQLLDDKLKIEEIKNSQQKSLLKNFSNATVEYLQYNNRELYALRNGFKKDKKYTIDDRVFMSDMLLMASEHGLEPELDNRIRQIYDILKTFENKESENGKINEIKKIRNNGGNTSYRLFNPGKYLNNDQELPMVMTRQGVSWYVDCRSAEILEKNGNATTVRFDLLIVNDDGMDRQTNELRLWTGKGVAVESNASGSWQPINEMTATRAQYNAGLILIDYFGLN